MGRNGGMEDELSGFDITIESLNQIFSKFTTTPIISYLFCNTMSYFKLLDQPSLFNLVYKCNITIRLSEYIPDKLLYFTNGSLYNPTGYIVKL